MRIEHQCWCGEHVVFEDFGATPIHKNGLPDKQGRHYLIEVWYDTWLCKHLSEKKSLGRERMNTCASFFGRF